MWWKVKNHSLFENLKTLNKLPNKLHQCFRHYDSINKYWIDPVEYFCPDSSSLSTIYDSSKSKVLKMVKMKNEKKFTNKKPAATPTFCKQNFSWMHHIDFIQTLFSVPSLSLGPIRTTHVWSGFETEECALTQSMDKINVVHPRKILFAETWGSIRFFICNFFFVFHFDHFQGFGFGSIIDCASRGSVTAKIFIWVKLVWVKST